LVTQWAMQSSSSEVNEALVCRLHWCEFMSAAEDVVLGRSPGTGEGPTRLPRH